MKWKNMFTFSYAYSFMKNVNSKQRISILKCSNMQINHLDKMRALAYKSHKMGNIKLSLCYENRKYRG